MLASICLTFAICWLPWAERCHTFGVKITNVEVATEVTYYLT